MSLERIRRVTSRPPSRKPILHAPASISAPCSGRFPWVFPQLSVLSAGLAHSRDRLQAPEGRLFFALHRQDLGSDATLWSNSTTRTEPSPAEHTWPLHHLSWFRERKVSSAFGIVPGMWRVYRGWLDVTFPESVRGRRRWIWVIARRWWASSVCSLHWAFTAVVFVWYTEFIRVYWREESNLCRRDLIIEV